MSFVKLSHGILCPADTETEQRVEALPMGQVLHGDWKKMRNPQFHRKFFAMLNFAFHVWEPGDIDTKRGPAQKSFERFREEVTILAGHYEVVIGLDGDPRLKAKSISFAQMDDSEFAVFYSSVADVVLQRVLTSYSRDDLDAVVDQVLGFC